VAALLDLEVASGNDAMSSHSEMRKTGKLMTQLLPGTDFITSGYSSMPRYDNLFGGGSFDSAEYDDWLVLQRDFLVSGGIVPVQETHVLEARRKGAKALQALFKGLGFPPIEDHEVEAATYAYNSSEMPERDRVEDLKASERILTDNITGAEIALALKKQGYPELARRILEMQRQRVAGDYLQTSAIFDENFMS